MADEKKVSVVGFLFWRRQVLLIRKARPSWQAGRLNGVGGQVEDGETTEDTMAREGTEETGLEIDWTLRVQITHQRGTVLFYSHHSKAANLPNAKNPDESEPLEWHPVDALPHDVLPNLRWLIPLCCDPAVTGMPVVQYDSDVARQRRCSIPPDCLGKRYLVASASTGPVIGTVESSTDDGVVLYDLKYPDGRKGEADDRLAISEKNITAFMPWPPSEHQMLLLAEFMYQDGLNEARKE